MIIKTIILNILLIPLITFSQENDFIEKQNQYEKLYELLRNNSDSHKLKELLTVCLEDNTLKQNKALINSPLYLKFDLEKFHKIQENILAGYFVLYTDTIITLKEAIELDSLELENLCNLIEYRLAHNFLFDGTAGNIDSDYFKLMEYDNDCYKTMKRIIKSQNLNISYPLAGGSEVCLKEHSNVYEKVIKFQRLYPNTYYYNWKGLYDKETKLLKKCGYYVGGGKVGVHNEYDEKGILIKQINYDDPPTDKYDEKGQIIPSSDVSTIKLDPEKFSNLMSGQYLLKDSTKIYAMYGGSQIINVTIFPHNSAYTCWSGRFYEKTKTLKESGNFYAGKNAEYPIPIGVHSSFDESGNILSKIDYDKDFKVTFEDVALKLKSQFNLDILEDGNFIIYKRTDPQPYYYIDLGGEIITINGVTGEMKKDLKNKCRG